MSVLAREAKEGGARILLDESIRVVRAATVGMHVRDLARQSGMSLSRLVRIRPPLVEHRIIAIEGESVSFVDPVVQELVTRRDLFDRGLADFIECFGGEAEQPPTLPWGLAVAMLPQVDRKELETATLNEVAQVCPKERLVVLDAAVRESFRTGRSRLDVLCSPAHGPTVATVDSSFRAIRDSSEWSILHVGTTRGVKHLLYDPRQFPQALAPARSVVPP